MTDELILQTALKLSHASRPPGGAERADHEGQAGRITALGAAHDATVSLLGAALVVGTLPIDLHAFCQAPFGENCRINSVAAELLVRLRLTSQLGSYCKY